MSDRLTGLFVLEGIALGIALALPVTPGKTGATWSPAELVTPDPSYPEAFVASFVAVNLILLLLGLVVWITVRAGRRPE